MPGQALNLILLDTVSFVFQLRVRVSIDPWPKQAGQRLKVIRLSNFDLIQTNLVPLQVWQALKPPQLSPCNFNEDKGGIGMIFCWLAHNESILVVVLSAFKESFFILFHQVNDLKFFEIYKLDLLLDHIG